MTANQPLRDRADLALAYTPGVAAGSRWRSPPTRPSPRVHLARSNTVAVVTDGTAVLGLGDIGPLAALPVMEGKAVLFKEFGGIDSVPICLDTADVGRDRRDHRPPRAHASAGSTSRTSRAPRCFEIERRLQERLDIPVFHDDQHGTAIVVLAALRERARRSLAATWPTCGVVVSGAGAAGVAITRILARRRGPRPRGLRLARASRPEPRTTWPRTRPAGGDDQPTRAHRHHRGGAGGRRRLRRRLRRHRCPRRPWPRWRATASSSPWPTPTRRCTRTWRARHARGRRHGPQSTTPTRSTTCWRSRASSAARSDSGATRITEEMKLAAATGDRRPGGRTRPRADRAERVRRAGQPGRGRGGGPARARGPALRRSPAAVPVG